MRVMLKTGRCLKKSYLFLLFWMLAFSVYTFSSGNVSFARNSVLQGRVGGRKTASVDNVLDTIDALGKDIINAAGQNVKDSEADITGDEIRRRVVNSRAGGFTYVSGGNNSVYDSSRGRFRLIDRYLKKNEHGFFLELGTEGNESGSLTYLLEKSRGWTGLVIEPIAEKFESLMHLKRNSKFLDVCINATGEDWPAKASSGRQCHRLTDILKAIECNKIDLLVLDVMEHEMQLLTSFPFKYVDVSMISIELHGTDRYVIQIVNELSAQFKSVQLMTNHIYGKTDMIFLNKQIKT